MTGFNNRIVNPGGQPLKGYWVVVEDCGIEGEWWRKVTWTDNLPLTNCAGEVQVRAEDDRQALANAAFVAATNNVALVGVKGRYIEVRVALTRQSATNNPVLYDLTLHGRSTAFEDWYLDDEVEFETDDATFVPIISAPEPLRYQWCALYPWAYDWEIMAGQTNATLTLTNVDSWDHENRFGVEVASATGESLFVGPALLSVVPFPITIPSSGAASRYPATIEVFGQPTSFASVEVTLTNLSPMPIRVSEIVWKMSDFVRGLYSAFCACTFSASVCSVPEMTRRMRLFQNSGRVRLTRRAATV